MLAVVVGMDIRAVPLGSEYTLNESPWHQCKYGDEDPGGDDCRCEYDRAIGHILIIEDFLVHQVRAVSREIQAERGDSEAKPKLHDVILADTTNSRKIQIRAPQFVSCARSVE